MELRKKFSVFLACVAVSLFVIEKFGVTRAYAHPISQGRMDVTIEKQRILVKAAIALEEVCISNQLLVNEASVYSITGDHVRKHGEYLLKHVFVYADGKPLTGKVLKHELPEKLQRKLGPEEIQIEMAHYEFEYALPAGAEPPAVLLMKQDVLNEVLYAPGNPWQATYVMTVGQIERQPIEGMLLTSTQPMLFTCDWSAPPATLVPPAPGEKIPARVDTGATAKEFMKHGIQHILEGYDHLLFVTALVLAAVSFWDLIKVVSVFTLSHSLTLALSALGYVKLDSSIVEPMIAASIVFVALQNAFFPKRSRGWVRLAAAFFFGLFHGLGFAGGCLEAMEGMQMTTVLLAIASFSIGVEIGHQIVVLPTFALLTLLRRAQKEPAKVEKFNHITLKYGSLAISAAGMFYLVTALGWFHIGSNEEKSGQKQKGSELRRTEAIARRES